MEGKETRNSNNNKKVKQIKTKQQKRETQTLAKDREGREEKNGNQKTDCVHKLY